MIQLSSVFESSTNDISTMMRSNDFDDRLFTCNTLTESAVKRRQIRKNLILLKTLNSKNETGCYIKCIYSVGISVTMIL